MALHLAGWYQSVDPGGNYTQLNALEDERIFTESKALRINKLTQLAGAAVCAATAATADASAYLYSPSMNIVGDNFITPVNENATAGVPNSVIVGWQDWSDDPIDLKYNELMRAYLNANPAAAGAQGVFILMTDGTFPAIPSGPHITWRGTFTAPSNTGAWSPATVSWQSELPAGDYAIIGMQVIAATSMAARINTRQGEQWRPGVLIQPANTTIPADYQRSGKLGVWAMFPHTQLPTVEVVANTAAAGTIYLDIVRMNEGQTQFSVI